MEISREHLNFQIRRLEPADYEAVYQIFCGPRAVWGTLQIPFPSAESWRKRLAEPRDGSYHLAASFGNELVGQLGIDTFANYPRRRHAAELGMAVRDDWQGKGVGTALMQAAVDMADKWLNITRLELQVYTDNEPAVQLYKKFGFAIEGTLRCFAYRDGQYVDAYTMARIREGV
jgi:L-phenylalanine/L-methionine N-acetyltransferase